MKEYKIYYCGEHLDSVKARSKKDAIKRIFEECNWDVRLKKEVARDE